MKPFTKIVNPGVTNINGRVVDVFCKITFDGKRLSITGVEGPRRNGDCFGSWGQINPLHFEVEQVGGGWTRNIVERFNTVWAKWHLNDMRAGCEHQRALGWKSCPGHYPTKEERDRNVRATCSGATEPWPNDRRPAATSYRCSEDMVGKPCPECGYEYGSAWLFEEVPEDVLRWLAALPKTPRQPAWV